MHAMDAPRGEMKTTTCYMCACRCGIRVHLKNGEIRYIDGNPDHPLNKGVICAKGASGIMKQKSPARLTRPLRRKAGAERGAGDFEPISWDEAFSILEERLKKIRASDPKKFAFFTGCDQMQALTGLFARQFGTPNYAAHGGFCSVNMAVNPVRTGYSAIASNSRPPVLPTYSASASSDCRFAGVSPGTSLSGTLIGGSVQRFCSRRR